MSKKIINSKLENLFVNISEVESSTSKFDTIDELRFNPQDNWAWETDVNGIIIECGKEISDVLGFNRLDVIGQPFFSFSLNVDEQQKIREVIHSGEFPAEIELNYNTKLGNQTRVRTSILQKFDEKSNLIGYKFISQKIIAKDEVESQGSTPISSSVESHIEDHPPLRWQDFTTRPLTSVESPSKEKNVARSKTLSASEKPKIVKPRTNPSQHPSTPQISTGKTAPLPPIPFPESEYGKPVSISPTMISGITLVDNEFSTASKVWTDKAIDSFTKDVLVSSPAKENGPAVIAMPLKLRDQKTGVIEILDFQNNRRWTEEERLLVQEVTNQLGLALENAQLYSAVQKELNERVKAEEETSKRNEALAKLNLVMQQLTRLVSREEIFSIVSEAIQDLFSTGNILITLFDSKNNEFAFPVCAQDGEMVQIPSRLSLIGYQESVIESRSPLLVNYNITDRITDQHFDHPNGLPRSLLAVPLLAGDRVLGVISVLDYRQENAFDEIQVELLSTIAGQTATALENNNLFREISQALETIEVRERYQSNVTNAVASLSEKGSSTIDFLLESLSNAAKCDRVSYLGINDKSKDSNDWKILACYTAKDRSIPIATNLDKTFQVPSELVDHVQDQGFFQCSVETATDLEKAFLDELKARSILILGINTGEGIPTFLLLEELTFPHLWKQEEINILTIASDAFSNTLLREGLLQQVQASLDETENLYSASHQLALANTLSEMVASIIEGINIPAINRGILVLFGYGPNQEIEKLSVEAHYYNGKGTPPPPVGTEYLISLYKPIFAIEDPVFYDDLLDAQIDEQLRKIFTSQNIRSMGILPLWSGNVQLGVLLIQTWQKHRFGPQEIRSFPPLVDQMSTAIQNLKLFEQTQAALAETELLYNISSGISRATSLEEYLRLVGANAMPKNAQSLWLFVANRSLEGSPQYYEITGSSDSVGQFSPHGGIVEASLFNFVDFSESEPVVISNVMNSVIPEQTQKLFRNLELNSLAILPMQTAGTPVGLLVVGTNLIVDLNIDDIHTLQVVASSIAVAIERQRLLSESQRRALELQTAAEIARDTTSTLSLDILLSRIVSLVKERFQYYHCSIFLVDESNEFAVIREGSGDAGKELKQRNFKFAVGSKSVIGSCTSTGEPVLVNDVSSSSLFTPNPLLPATRSELVLPLKITGKVIGAIDLHASQPDAFDADDLKVLQILADQVAVAVDNARAYEVSQRAVEEMRELDRVKSQFLANMSHELRTPLNSVIGFSRVILKGIDGPINETQEQDITAIYNSGMHLLNMINEILDLSKIEAGKMELQFDDVNISDVINSAISTAAGLVKDKPIELIQKVPATLPTVQADEIRLSQVLINLISNAVKFTEKGSITVEASLQKNAQNKSEILVTVTDTGIGIAKEDQNKLFQRFSQVDDSPTRKTGGTGLGLSICRSFIEMHGGKIGLLHSEVGKGSVFFFTIPAPESTSAINLDHLINGENVILSIDDDAQVISLYDRFLRPHGYEVVPLTDPTQAVQKARELKPFAITLDIMMPQKDGWQVLKDLKKDEQTRNIPIMICSILEEEEKGFNLGASEYLVKPFLQDDLASAIQRLSKDKEIHDVLIVDDDPSDLRLLKKMIEDEGKYMAVLADSGAAALQLLNDFTPDIIILDLFMPGINGFELLEKLKKEPRLSGIPTIVLTGADLEVDQQKFISDYGNQIITKSSLNKNDLLQHLQETLNRIRPTRLVN